MTQTTKPKRRAIGDGIPCSLAAVAAVTLLSLLPNTSLGAISPTQAGYIDVTQAPYGALEFGPLCATELLFRQRIHYLWLFPPTSYHYEWIQRSRREFFWGPCRC